MQQRWVKIQSHCDKVKKGCSWWCTKLQVKCTTIRKDFPACWPPYHGNWPCRKGALLQFPWTIKEECIKDTTKGQTTIVEDAYEAVAVPINWIKWKACRTSLLKSLNELREATPCKPIKVGRIVSDLTLVSSTVVKAVIDETGKMLTVSAISPFSKKEDINF